MPAAGPSRKGIIPPLETAAFAGWKSLCLDVGRRHEVVINHLWPPATKDVTTVAERSSAMRWPVERTGGELAARAACRATAVMLPATQICRRIASGGCSRINRRPALRLRAPNAGGFAHSSCTTSVRAMPCGEDHRLDTDCIWCVGWGRDAQRWRSLESPSAPMQSGPTLEGLQLTAIQRLVDLTDLGIGPRSSLELMGDLQAVAR